MTRSARARAERPIDDLMREVAALPQQLLRHLIHQLIGFLSETDTDPNLEDGGDQEFVEGR